MKKILGFVGKVLLYGLLIPFTASLFGLPALFLDLPYWVVPALMCAATALWYFLLRKKLDRVALWVDAIYLAVMALGFTGLMIAAGGNTEGVILRSSNLLMIPYFPSTLLWLGYSTPEGFGTAFLAELTALILALVLQKKPVSRRVWILGGGVLAVLLAVNLAVYSQRPQKRWKTHNFDYMNGYSSTDFTDYYVTAEPGKLAKLPGTASLRISDAARMPVMDGAEACYPLYAAVAKAVYQGIEKIEAGHEAEMRPPSCNGIIVQFTNSVNGFYRLLNGEINLFFGAKPSPEQLEDAKSLGVELELTPIAREAFVFFVEESNPIRDLSCESLRAIYHGDITDWSELGGRKGQILAFQRPRNSGSQTMMEYFMGDVSLKTPVGYEVVGAMSMVLHIVAEYKNEAGAIGYSFRYFMMQLQEEPGVRMLSVDGIAPTKENIVSGAYPLINEVYLITRKDDPNPYVRQMIDFLLSEEGQYLVEKTGYCPLK